MIRCSPITGVVATKAILLTAIDVDDVVATASAVTELDARGARGMVRVAVMLAVAEGEAVMEWHCSDVVSETPLLGDSEGVMVRRLTDLDRDAVVLVPNNR